jgi:hypothetical protein
LQRQPLGFEVSHHHVTPEATDCLPSAGQNPEDALACDGFVAVTVITSESCNVCCE